MIADLKPYPAMKDSGVPWLGEVPKHWEARRFRNIADMRVSNVDKHTREDEMPVRLCNYIDVYKNNRIHLQMPFMSATASVEEIARFRLERGDVLITKDSEVWTDIGVPALVKETADDLICGYHLALLRPHRGRINGEYLFRALQSTALAYQFHVEATGVTRYGLSHAAIKSIWLPLPPLVEQAVIVRFLDHASRRIERYIRAKKKLIALLTEQKQAIIHRAVTCGLDPNVRPKSPGIPWLGEIPAHWKILPLKRIARIIDGDRGREYPNVSDFVTEGIPFLSSKSIMRGKIDFRNVAFISETKFSRLRQGKLTSGDLVITVRGTIGNCALFTGDEYKTGFINAQMMIIRPDNEGVLNTYLATLAGSRYWMEQLGLSAYGSAQQQLSNRILSDMRIPIPSIEEQNSILLKLRDQTNPLDGSISHAECEIMLMREYRTRLTADVVTGQLDVREAAAKLPEEPEELEPLDDAEPCVEGEETPNESDLDPEVVEEHV